MIFISETECEQCCYCFVCLIVFALIFIFFAFSITFWWLAFPFIFAIIAIQSYIRKQRSNRIYLKFDTKNRQEEFERETGYKAIEHGKLTQTYKAWINNQAELRRRAITHPSPYKSQPVYQPQPPPQPQTKPIAPSFDKQIEVPKAFFCPYCGVKNPPNAKHCKSCGSNLD